MYPKTANRVHNVTYWMNYIMHQVMLQTYLKELLSPKLDFDEWEENVC
jgi:hypothetical protein